MPVIDIQKDPAALTMTVKAEFPVSVERAWQLFADPRQLEQWWGPPTYPAKVTRHDLSPGGTVVYTMTGPEGDQHHGWWRVLATNPPHGFEVEDGFGDAEGNPNPDMPSMRMRFSIDEVEGGARLTSVTTFPSLESMEQLVQMGMEEGTRAAMGQIDDVLKQAA